MDPYALLELEPGASEEEIKRAWKRLARKHHPDLNQDDPDAEAHFIQIKAAYDALMAGDAPGGAPLARMDSDWVDSVDWMAEVRRRAFMGDLLPRFVAAYGSGAALAWALAEAEDLEAAAAALPPARPQWVVRRMRLEVVIEDRRRGWGLASIERRSDGRLQLILFASVLWANRPPDEEALRQVVFAAVDHGLAAAVPAILKLRRVPASLDEARAIDAQRFRETWFWRTVWGAVGALIVVMISWAKWG